MNKTAGIRLRAACAAALILGAVPASANPSISSDFQRMTAWLSHELAQGIAFNAGSTFDPPHEVVSHRLQPDISVGVGKMPLDKTRFPVAETPAVQEMHPVDIFPSAVLFPNLAMHLRAGLPWRMDFSIRLANMTTPPNYKISTTATGKGQSNSIGLGLRRHFLGGPDLPRLSVGGNVNHVRGRFSLRTKFSVDDVAGFSSDSDVNGALAWNVTSFGLNAVLGHTYQGWTPFCGLGYNYAVGSVSAQLEALSETPLVAPIRGLSSEHPEQNAARAIVGLEMDYPWIHFFANGEVKTIGNHAGESWIAQFGVALPFEIGPLGFAKRKTAATNQLASAGEREAARLPAVRAPKKPSPVRVKTYPSTSGGEPGELIFIE